MKLKSISHWPDNKTIDVSRDTKVRVYNATPRNVERFCELFNSRAPRLNGRARHWYLVYEDGTSSTSIDVFLPEPQS